MQQALVQHTQHQVEGEQGRQDQQGLGLQRLLKRIRRSCKTTAHRYRHVQFRHSVFNVLRGLRQAHAGCEIEAEGVRGHTAFMRHRQRGVGEFHPRKTAQGHGLAQVVDELQTLQRLGALQMLGCQFHDHAVLVQGVVNHTHLALTKGIGQGRVNRAYRQAQTGRRIPVNHQRGLQATVFVIIVHVLQRLELGQGAAQFRLPLAQLAQFISLDAVLELGVAATRPHAQVLHGHQEQPRTGFLGQLGFQSVHHLVGGGASLGGRLQGHEHLRGVALAIAGEAGDGQHIRVGLHDGQHGLQALLHGLKRGALVGADVAVDASGVLLRKKPFGDGAVQTHVQHNRGQQHQPHQPLVPQCPGQAAAVPTRHTRSFVCASHRRVWWQPSRTHHRCGGERHHHRGEDGRGHHQSKFVEQTTQHAAHEQNGDEHRHQRKADGHHGEADVACALQTRITQTQSTFAQTRDVFQHHDGIVHHKAGGNRQGHQAQVVQAEVQQVHDHAGARQGQRHGHTGNECSAPTLQEQSHHQDHQGHRERQ